MPLSLYSNNAKWIHHYTPIIFKALWAACCGAISLNAVSRNDSGFSTTNDKRPTANASYDVRQQPGAFSLPSMTKGPQPMLVTTLDSNQELSHYNASMTKGPRPMLVTKLNSNQELSHYHQWGAFSLPTLPKGLWPMPDSSQELPLDKSHTRDSTTQTHSHCHWAGRLTNRGRLTQEWDQDQVKFSKCSKANWFYLLSPAFSSTPALCTLFNKLIPKSTLQCIACTVTVERTP